MSKDHKKEPVPPTEPAPPLEPARALVAIATGGYVGEKRVVLDRGEVLPEGEVAGLTEGVHYTRGLMPEEQKRKAFQAKDGVPRCLTNVTTSRSGERVNLVAGDTLEPGDLAGLESGVHYE